MSAATEVSLTTRELEVIATALGRMDLDDDFSWDPQNQAARRVLDRVVRKIHEAQGRTALRWRCEKCGGGTWSTVTDPTRGAQCRSCGRLQAGPQQRAA